MTENSLNTDFIPPTTDEHPASQPQPIHIQKPMPATKLLAKLKPFLLLTLIFSLLTIGAVLLYFKAPQLSQRLSWFNPQGLPPTQTKPSMTTPSANQVNPQTAASITQAHNLFAFDLLTQLDTAAGSDNLFFSPTSIALALSMTYNGADGSTKQEMAQVLHFDQLDIKAVNEAHQAMLARLSADDPQLQLAIANSIWAKKGVSFEENFLRLNQEFYEAEIDSLDFNSVAAVNRINDWVSQKTQGKIRDMVSYPISPQTVMYLINAIYFKGTWTYEFDPQLTNPQDFIFADQNRQQVEMMTQERKNFRYLEIDDFQAVLLPYSKDEKLAMLVFLPKIGLADFLGQVTAENWQQWLSSFAEKEGKLLLPKFKMEYEQELKDVLASLGMPTAFSDQANFSQMRPEKDLFISKVKHKSFVEVNEEGTEAAAATSVEIGLTSVGPEDDKFEMIVNKPFFFAIVDNVDRGQTGEILFMGVMREL